MRRRVDTASPNACMTTAESALQVARRHVADGSRLVDQQSVRIAQMDPHSDQIGPARALLETMKLTLEMFKADLARLEAKS